MIKSERFNTEQNFKNRIIFNSLSLRNIKWGKKNNNDNENSNYVSTTLKNLSSYNNQRLSTSESLKNKRIEKEINFEENEKKKEEEKNKKREKSYLARKKILLRLRQEDKNEEKNEDKKENIKYRKLRKFELKIPLDKIKLKKIGSNENINFNYKNNKEYFQHNMTSTKNKCKNNLFDNSSIKNVKTNFVLNGNIRNLYKNNKLKKDFKILTEKSCKILKVQKVTLDKNYNDNNVNKKVKQNFISSININNVYYNTSKKNDSISKELKEQTNYNEKKIPYSDNSLKKINNKNSILRYIERRKNRNCVFNITTNNNITTDFNENNIISSSIKNLKKVNSDFSKKQKKNEFKKKESNKKEKEENNIEIDESKRTLNGNENRILARFSYFNYFKKKNIRNELNKDTEKLIKSSDKLKLKLITNNSCKNSAKSKYKNKSIVNLRTLSINNLDLNQNNNENIYNSYLMLKSSGNEFNNEERKRINFFNKKLYTIHFFEELIDITNSINDRNLLKTLLNNLNIKYYFQNKYYDDKKYNNFFKENENFEYVFKHFGLVLICLIFFVNDNSLYDENNSKVKDLLIHLIYSSLNYVEIYGNKDSSKIYNFINKCKIQLTIPIRRYIISLILLLFDNKKEYIPLKNALEQLYDIIIKKDYKFLTEVLNNCILYCYNSKPKNLFSFTIFKSKSNTQIAKESHEKQNNDTISGNNNNSNNKNIPPIPFIRTTMKKKFCLVLDIDETISHSLKLSFGWYFLVRPGTIYFLKEVSKYYEIIIFTSSPKNYADNILNKIDISGDLISHRLYRNHVVFENGKSVKNLNKLGRDLTKTIFIDNLRTNAKYNLHNLCSITTWISDIFDDKLIKLKDKLIYIATCGKYDNDITQGI